VIRRELRLEILVAVVLTVILLLISPGLAFVGALALLLLIVWGASALIARARRRRGAQRSIRRPAAAPGLRLSEPHERAAGLAEPRRAVRRRPRY
jgi:uncharacterized protein (DUF58 family)